MEWAVASGLPPPRMAPNGSNDKPGYHYGLPSMDDNSLFRLLPALPSLQPRNYVVMEALLVAPAELVVA